MTTRKDQCCPCADGRPPSCSQTWDANGDGMVTKDEFRQVLHTLPSLAGSSPSAIDSLFASFDADGSGAITFTELNRMMRNAPGAEAGDASFKKRRRGPVVVCDVPVLKEEVSLTPAATALHASRSTPATTASCATGTARRTPWRPSLLRLAQRCSLRRRRPPCLGPRLSTGGDEPAADGDA